jgi:hypothetical protein
MGQFSRVLVRPPSARSAMAAVSAAELGVLMRKIQAYEPDLFDLVLSFVPRTLMQPQSNDHGTYSVGLVGSSAFRNCSRLVEVVLPRSITRIGVQAFLYCRHLTELTLPECLTHIDDFAFQGCIALRAVVLPNSLVHIGSMTLAQCTALTELMLPDQISVSRGCMHARGANTHVTEHGACDVPPIPASPSASKQRTFVHGRQKHRTQACLANATAR